ncbi:MAG TPA: response regulator [Candidatus Paceibacterota bacterium]
MEENNKRGDQARKEKILLAINNKSFSSALAEKLNKRGYATLTIDNGEEALKYMREQNPDMALIDLALSVKDGYEVLTEKSFDRLITKIPAMVISHSGSPIEVRRIPSTSSVKDYIIKTHIEPDEVIAKIDNFFGYEFVKDNYVNNKDDPKKSQKKVLWIEDDKLLGMILVKKFESYGHIIFKAENGNDAFEYLKKDIPDVILLDILLPDIDGFNFLQKMKMNEKLRHIPVIVLSNVSKESDREKAKALGADRYMVKAVVSLDEIVREVDSLTK